MSQLTTASFLSHLVYTCHFFTGRKGPNRSLMPGTYGPVPQNIRIADKVLEGAAEKADEVHDAFCTPAASLEGLTKQAVTALEGFQTSNALTRSHEKWEEQAGLVAGWITNIAQSLRLAARAYDGTDHGVKDGFDLFVKQSASPASSDVVYPPSYLPYLAQDGDE